MIWKTRVCCLICIITFSHDLCSRATVREHKLGIGIQTGDTVAGNAKMEYTFYGDTVNLASRIEGATKLGIGSA